MRLYSHMLKNKKEVIVFIVIMLTACFFRLYQLDKYPPGLYPDIAMNGNNAIRANDTGQYQVFYPENNGREGLFINLQALSIRMFGKTIWSLKFVAAATGILTVAGLYLLVRMLLNWQIAAISSFLMAVSFWHVLFSRLGFRAIMAPMLLTWGIYFFWRGLVRGRIGDFLVSGIIWGLGFYTYIAFRVMPLVLVMALVGWWQTIKKDFGRSKYEHTRLHMALGIEVFIVAMVLTASPLAYYFYSHPQDFLGRSGQLSVFASQHPIKDLAGNTLKTLGMFTFTGDHNWRHNYSGEPLLFWPVGALFAVGFLKSWLKLFRLKKTHGHLSTVHTLLLSWFLVGLVPVVLSNEGLPHALRAIVVAPVVFIFAGEGLWWLFEWLERWYRERDRHRMEIVLPKRHRYFLTESAAVTTLVIVIFLFSIAFAEYDKYFHRYGPNPNVASANAQNYTNIAALLNLAPKETIKYVVVNAGGVLVRTPGPAGKLVPMPAQTVMYLTDTWSEEKQKAKNLYYLSREEYRQNQFNRNSIVVILE